MMLDPLSIRTVVTHSYGDTHCPDGVASALLVSDALGFDRVNVKFIRHGAELATLKVEPGLLFVDIAPTPERAAEFLTAGSYVLDHHKGSREVVEMFVREERGVFADEAKDPGVCGAVLAFNYLWRPSYPLSVAARTNAERFATLAGIRDTWQRSHPDFEEACAHAEMLRFFPWETWKRLKYGDRSIFTSPDHFIDDRMEIGRILFKKQGATVARVADRESLRFTTKKGTRVAMFEGTHLSSDVAEYLHDTVDLVVGFSNRVEGGEPKLVVSARSHTSFDCAEWAKTWKGGGHTRAAGFSIPIAMSSDLNAFAMLRDDLDRFEAGARVF